VPLIAALVQQPWITPELSIGPPVIAAPAVVTLASKMKLAPALITMAAGRLIVISSVRQHPAAEAFGCWAGLGPPWNNPLISGAPAPL
jgi:hypothetical protein